LSTARFQRNPGSLTAWITRAEAEWRLCGRLEALETCSPEYLASLVRADPAGMAHMVTRLSDLANRAEQISGAATDMAARIAETIMLEAVKERPGTPA